MKIFSNQVNINGSIKGTGWLPPRPDLRDYGDEHEKIRGIFSAQGAERRAQGKTVAQGAERKAQSKTIAQGALPAPRTPHLAPDGKVDLREFCSPIEDQGSLGSCTAHAAAGIVEYYERRAFNRHIEASRLFLYKTTRNLMQTTGDTGGWIRCTMGALVLCGIPDEKYWPYDVAKFDKEPPAFVYSVANNYQAVKYFRHDPSGAGLRAQGSGEEGSGRRAQGTGEEGSGEEGSGHRAQSSGENLGSERRAQSSEQNFCLEHSDKNSVKNQSNFVSENKPCALRPVRRLRKRVSFYR